MRRAILSAALVSATGLVLAADPADLGEREYKDNCAVCHGLSGKGDGPFMDLISVPSARRDQTTLTTPIADLTALSKKNKGVFPFLRVYQVIDGTQTVKAHGTREMPIWGVEYKLRAEPLKDESGRYFYDPGVFARARILALTEYVYRLQEK